MLRVQVFRFVPDLDVRKGGGTGQVQERVFGQLVDVWLVPVMASVRLTEGERDALLLAIKVLSVLSLSSSLLGRYCSQDSKLSLVE